MTEIASTQRRKALIVLAAVAGVAAVMGAASFMPPAQDIPRAEVGQLVLPAFASKVSLVEEISVTTAEEKYHLVRGPNGWVMAEKGGYPVGPARIADLTQALSAITYAGAMTRDEKKFDRIGLGDPAKGGTGALIDVGTGKGVSFGKLIVGYRDGRSYVRAPDDLQAWAVNGLMPPLQRAAWWLDLAVAPLKADEIAGVDVRPAEGPSYRLVPNADGGFSLSPPYNTRQLVAAFAPSMSAEALTRLSAIDVTPSRDIAVGAPLSEHITRTKSGIAIVVRSWKVKTRGWVTISAATGEGASPETLKRAETINERAAPWAFALTDLDWGSFSTPLAAIVD